MSNVFDLSLSRHRDVNYCDEGSHFEGLDVIHESRLLFRSIAVFPPPAIELAKNVFAAKSICEVINEKSLRES